MEFCKVKLQMLKEKNCNYNSRKVKSTTDVVKYINEIEKLGEMAEEYAILICVNSKNQILSYSEIAKGGINFCNFDMGSLFKNVLLCNAKGFILVHNHPSGHAKPSKEDLEITGKIEIASTIMGVAFLDHIVIANNDFESCKRILMEKEKLKNGK